MAVLKVKVQPSASKSEIVGFLQDRLKIKVNAPPEDGKANKACIELLAEKLQIKKSAIELIRGFSSKEKELSISGLTSLVLKNKINIILSIK